MSAMARATTRKKKKKKALVPRGKPRGLVVRADGSAMRRLTVYVEPELYKRVKVHVAGLDSNLSEWVAALLERELG